MKQIADTAIGFICTGLCINFDSSKVRSYKTVQRRSNAFDIDASYFLLFVCPDVSCLYDSYKNDYALIKNLEQYLKIFLNHHMSRLT